MPIARLNDVWVIQTKSGGYLYRMKDGLLRYCRYASRSKAERDIRSMVHTATFVTVPVDRRKLARMEREDNEFRDTPERLVMVKKIEDVVKYATEYLDKKEADERIRRSRGGKVPEWLRKLRAEIRAEREEELKFEARS